MFPLLNKFFMVFQFHSPGFHPLVFFNSCYLPIIAARVLWLTLPLIKHCLKSTCSFSQSAFSNLSLRSSASGGDLTVPCWDLLRVVPGTWVSLVSGKVVVGTATCLLAYLTDLVEGSLWVLVVRIALLVWHECMSVLFLDYNRLNNEFKYLVELFQWWVVQWGSVVESHCFSLNTIDMWRVSQKR